MHEERGRLVAEAQKKLDETKKHEAQVWTSHTHSEVQVTEWKRIQEEEVKLFQEFTHKLEEVEHASHDDFVIAIHEASPEKSVQVTQKRVEQETVVYKEFVAKLEAIDIQFKETVMKEVVSVEEKEKTKKKDEEVQKKLEKAQNAEIEKKKEEAEAAAKKKPEPPKKEEPKIPDIPLTKAEEGHDITIEAVDDEEEHGVLGDAPDDNFEKEARAHEGGAFDPEGDQEAKEEEEELKRAEKPAEVKAPEPTPPPPPPKKEKKIEAILRQRETNDKRKVKAIIKNKKLTNKEKKEKIKKFTEKRKESLKKVLDEARVEGDDKKANKTAADLAKKATTEEIYQVLDRYSPTNKLLMNGKAYISVTNAFPKILKLGPQIDAKSLEMRPLRNTTTYTSMELQLNKQGNSLYYWTFTLGASDGKGGKSPNAYLRDTPGVFNSLNSDQDTKNENVAEKRKISTSKVNKAQRE